MRKDFYLLTLWLKRHLTPSQVSFCLPLVVLVVTLSAVMQMWRGQPNAILPLDNEFL